jgi:cytochrome oxidase Cu insertion factor (SCO1/SenC/PrrC family)
MIEAIYQSKKSIHHKKLKRHKTAFVFSVFFVMNVFMLNQSIAAQSTDMHQHHQHAAKPAEPAAASQLTIPDVTVRDQFGNATRFQDLLKDKTVAVNFVFTTCTTICPPMGANFGQLRSLLGERAGKDVRLISVSVDPLTDTAQRLKTWSEKFNAGAGWTLVTGAKSDIDALLKAFGVFTADKWDHSPTALIGNVAAGEWRRVNGLAAPAKLVEVINEVGNASATAPAAAGNEPSAAARYFTDVELTNHDGQPMRLYSDVLKGRVVIVNSFFTSCRESCPMMAATFAKLQARLGDRLGKDVFLVSISVDPTNDTPTKLKEFAASFKALPGWLLLTGSKDNVELALKKLGLPAENRDAHSNLFIIGNEPTGLWKKAFGLASPAEILKVVESVLNDRG